MEDQKIIKLYQERSETAITETSLKYGNLCRSIAYNILHNKEDTEECVNDTYLKAWNCIPPQVPNSLSAFLGRITRNLALHKYEYYHAKKRYSEFDLIFSELEDCIPGKIGVESQYESGEIGKAISNFLYTLDSECRIIFVRRYWYSDSIADIMNRFSMSKSKVESMLYRTRNKLKTYLMKEGIWL